MKKHLFFLYSICIIMICGLFHNNIPSDLTHSFFENEPIPVMAAPARHTDIKHAKTLRSGTSFRTKAAPEGFHYYCLFTPTSKGEITIRIQSSRKISLSFQLYDQKGLLYPPSDYSYDPEEHLLTIHYDITAYRRYLLGLYNDQKQSLRYTITYSYTKAAPSPSPVINHKRSPQKPKPSGTAKPQTHRKNAQTSVRKSANPASTNKPDKTVSSKKKNILKNNNKNSFKKTTGNAANPNMKTRIKNAGGISKITLSNTFLHIKKGETFSLHATAVSSQKYHLNWEFSSGDFLKKISVQNHKNSADITLTANRSGMIIITCRTKENRTISCSCTIKITE